MQRWYLSFLPLTPFLIYLQQYFSALGTVLPKSTKGAFSSKSLLTVIYLFIYLLFSHNKDYTSITLYKDVARGPQKTTRLVRGGPLVTIILSNRTITTHNNGQYKTHYRLITFASNGKLEFVPPDQQVSPSLVAHFSLFLHRT